MNDDTTRCLRDALESHFHPDTGTPYWLDVQDALGIDVRREIRTVDDLAVLGAFDREAWVERPLSDFVPRGLWQERTSLILAESGGTSGRPVRCVYTAEELDAAFVAPYMAVSASRGFPTGGEWLFVGPTGPHVIGRTSQLLARSHGAMAPYAVDLDPRWARAQVEGSFGRIHYTRHVLTQALDVLDRENVTVLFVTPPLALALATELDGARRERIAGIHLGGMAVASDAYAAIRAAFPRAVVLPGYGNSMFGLLIEAGEPEPDADGTLHLDYAGLPGRLLVRVVPDDDGAPDVSRTVGLGERGRVVLSRLDRSFLVVNHVERDRATRIATPHAAHHGLCAEGVRDPYPVVAKQAIEGLY